MNWWRWLPRSALARLVWGLPLGTLLVLAVVLVTTYRIARTDIEVLMASAVAEEVLGLEGVFHDAGIEALTAEIEGRVESDVDPAAIYLLIDGRDRKLAGNLSSWPKDVPRVDEAAFRVRDSQGDELQGKVLRLFGKRMLLVGRRSPLAATKVVLARNLLIAGALVVVVSVVLSTAALVPLRRRLAALHEQARLIREGDLSQRVAVNSPGDELDELAADFNGTFAELERALDGAKYISSMIAHDMRRPITALRYQLDDLLREPKLDAVTGDAVTRAISATDEILATFGALLQLARLESHTYVATQQPFNFADLVRDAVETYEPVADAAGMSIVAELAPARMRGDRNLWFQVLQNLLENAIRYGAGSIEVQVAVSRDGASADRADQHETNGHQPNGHHTDGHHTNGHNTNGHTLALRVRDHGPGVADTDLPHLFERFYRAEEARTSGGSGVGLALVRAIVELHGGTVRAENARPGLRICVSLAAADSAAN